jgi:phenylacetate-CoA ligase
MLFMDKQTAQKLHKLCLYAKEHTDYYFDNIPGNSLNGQMNKAAFMTIAILSKDEIRRDYKRFLSKQIIENECISYSSSGTTGVPTKFIRTRQEQSHALLQISRERRKWSNKAFNGSLVNFYINKEPITYYYKDGKKLEATFSVFDTSKERFDLFVASIRDFKPTMIQGYASTLLLLAKHILKYNHELPPIEMLENRAEHLTAGQRMIIEKAFKAKIANHYGLTEVYPIAYDCLHQKLHIRTDNVYLEVLDINGEPVTDGEKGEIVVTNLYNFSMPLIRYRTGDMGAISTEMCECGSHKPVLELTEGRISDKVLTRNGEMNAVAIHSVTNQFFKAEYSTITQLQIVQYDITDFHINLIPLDLPNQLTAQIISSIFQTLFDYPVTVKVNWVNELEFHPVSRKVNVFVSKMNNN